MKESKVKVNEIYSSNHSGDFIVLKPMGTMNKNMTYLVRFLKTGYETITRYDSILNGTVKDPYFPRIYGVGYFGEPSEQNKAMYHRWRCMLSRCYNPNNKRYKQYGGIGVRVCDRWLCYATYLNDIKTLPGYDDMIRNPQIQYCLDKDMLQKDIPHSQRVYSPETCMFIPLANNISFLAVDNASNYNCVYHNVYCTGKTYKAEIQIDGQTMVIGRFEDPMIAASACDYTRNMLGMPILNPGIPYVDPQIIIGLNLRPLQEVIRVINK